MTDPLLIAAREIDPHTVVFYLEVPRSQIVLLQTYFELYDGIGTVRTLETPRNVVSVFTTPGLKNDCIEMLNAIRENVAWRVCSEIPEQI